MPELTPSNIRKLNELVPLAPKVKLTQRAHARALASALMAAEWPKAEARLRAADVKRRRRNRKRRLLKMGRR